MPRGIHMIGRKLPLETRRKIATANTGRIKSPEEKAKISAAKMGNTGGRGNRGKVHSEQSRKNMSLAHAGQGVTHGLSYTKEYRAIHSQNRKARLKNVGGSFTVGEWERLKAQYDWTCPCCRKKKPDIKLTIDHIVPVIKGGSNNIENIQPLCGSCNSRKGTKIVLYEQ